MHILIMGSPNDGHIEIVTKQLTVPYTIIDTNAIRDGVPLSFRTNNERKTSILYDGTEVSDVTAVWCKRLSIDFQGAKYTVDPVYSEYSQAAVRDFLASLSVSFDNAYWISPYAALLRAANKQLHLTMAKRLGLSIPDTLITSDPAAAQEFIDSREATIVKPFLPKIMVHDDGSGKFFFAAKVKKGEPLDYKTLPIAPLIFQTAIETELDIRVFVVGKKLFAASITGNESNYGRLRDWRTAQFDGSLEVAAHELPAQIARKCIQLVKDMGLVYGAIDMLLDKEGKYWFLEVNNSGAWRFVEDRTRQPIAAEIARLLNTAGK